MKANEPENKLQNAPVNELKENELESISGGLWGITLLDMCKGKFDENMCLHALGGPCPQLVVCDNKITNNGKGNIQDLYIYTCSKGCFKDVKFLKSVTY